VLVDEVHSAMFGVDEYPCTFGWGDEALKLVMSSGFAFTWEVELTVEMPSFCFARITGSCVSASCFGRQL
jgi:hypothetical protein